jgi:hypothetical protein
VQAEPHQPAARNFALVLISLACLSDTEVESFVLGIRMAKQADEDRRSLYADRQTLPVALHPQEDVRWVVTIESAQRVFG